MSDTCENAVSCCDPLFSITAPAFLNTEQCATAECEEGGTPTEVCVAAGTFSSTVSQQDANDQAYASALAQSEAAGGCALAGQLNGLMWKIPSDLSGNCVDPADQQTLAEGTTGQTYTVDIRIRGVVETKPYGSDGVPGTTPGDSHFYICTNPTQTIPAAPSDTWNEYALIVSDPPATMFLNNKGSRVLEVVDYTAQILVKGGATVTLKARTIDNVEVPNTVLIVNNAPPPIPAAVSPEPFLGQWLEMIVTAIS